MDGSSEFRFGAGLDPLHPRKMAASLQAVDKDGGPIMLLINKSSGDGGGTTITTPPGQSLFLKINIKYFACIRKTPVHAIKP